MTALAFDTAAPAMGVCVAAPHATVVCSLAAGLEHGARLAPLIDGALRQAGVTAADLELVVCGIGPGSFTGTRIGISTALGMTAGGGRCGLLGVSGLDAAGHRLRFFPGVVAPLIDARKGRLFAALYRFGRRLTGFLDESPERIRERLRAYPAVLLTGPAAPQLHADWGGGMALDPSAAQADAAALLSVGVQRYARQAVRRALPRPAYLRPSEAELGRPGSAAPAAPGARALPVRSQPSGAATSR